MTTRLLLLSLLVTFTATVGCATPRGGGSAGEADGAADHGIMGGDQVVRLPPDSDVDLESLPADPVAIRGARVEDDQLVIDVSYAGSEDAAHAFGVVWTGIAAMSLPPQMPLRLLHDAGGDEAEAMVIRELRFGLDVIDPPAVLNLGTAQGQNVRVTYPPTQAPANF
jgi:hypothetical protein